MQRNFSQRSTLARENAKNVFFIKQADRLKIAFQISSIFKFRGLIPPQLFQNAACFQDIPSKILIFGENPFVQHR